MELRWGLAQGEPSPAILVRLDNVNRRAGLALRQPANRGGSALCSQQMGAFRNEQGF